MNTITKLIKLETSCDNGGLKEVCFHSLGAVLTITGFCATCVNYQPDIDFSISHKRVCTKTKDCPKPTHFCGYWTAFKGVTNGRN